LLACLCTTKPRIEMNRYVRGFVIFCFIVLVRGNWFFPDKVHFELSQVLNKNCGTTPYSDRLKPEDGRIFENPWLVLLRHPEEQESFCQGTLISESHVLTTAICTEAIVPNETIITLGEYKRTTDPDCFEANLCNVPPIIELLAQKKIVHPDFQNDTYENDIAVVTMNERITYTNSSVPTVYNTLWTVEHKVPKQIHMKYIAQNECQQRMRGLILLQEGQICAQYVKPMELSFIGGSGSPLLIEYHSRTFQFGILSIGLPDATNTEPYIYGYFRINCTPNSLILSTNNAERYPTVLEHAQFLAEYMKILGSYYYAILKKRCIFATGHLLATDMCLQRQSVVGINVTALQQATEIVLGEYDLSTATDCITTWNCSLQTTRRSIDIVKIHPNFTTSFYENDIALLFMNASVQFDNNIRPICLPFVSIVDITDVQQQTIYNTIWSNDSIPRQIWMRNVPREICREQIKNLFALTEGHLCARIYGKHSVDMNGSAGSALQVDYHGRIFEYGLLSVGFPNETDAAPYLYIDIAKYINWIHESASM
uniref:Peptidase S1 domain-containing protein n=1 Tax=Anopheles coluzzii TaxID=1518534 RepID=A0A8W7PD25_ANOCL